MDSGYVDRKYVRMYARPQETEAEVGSLVGFAFMIGNLIHSQYLGIPANVHHPDQYLINFASNLTLKKKRIYFLTDCRM